jgi:hypothetical protein
MSPKLLQLQQQLLLALIFVIAKYRCWRCLLVYVDLVLIAGEEGYSISYRFVDNLMILMEEEEEEDNIKV